MIGIIPLIVQSFKLVQQQTASFLIHTLMVIMILFLSFIPSFAFGNQIIFMKEQTLSVTFFALIFYIIFNVTGIIKRDETHDLRLLLQAHGISLLEYNLGRYIGIVASLLPLLVSATIAGGLSASAVYESELNININPIICGLGAILSAYLFAVILDKSLNLKYQSTVNICLPLFLILSFTIIDGAYMELQSIGGVVFFLGFGSAVFTALILLVSKYFTESVLQIISIILVLLGILSNYIPYLGNNISLLITNFQNYYMLEKLSLWIIIFGIIQTILYLTLASIHVHNKK